MSARAPYRIGAVSYLNSLPLTVPLRDDPRVRLSEDVPSTVSDGLAEGTLDAGLVPLAEIFRHPEWTRVPGVGIVSHGPVETVLVVSRAPLAELSRIGMDVSSRTSVVLARIVLRDAHGVEPEAVAARPFEGEPEEDAWLVIGDPAFGVRPEENGCRVLDLGEAWRDLTATPMVYAAWALRAGLGPHERDEIGRILTDAARVGAPASLLDEEARARGIDLDHARRYLSGVITYEVEEAEEVGIVEFARRGAAWL